MRKACLLLATLWLLMLAATAEGQFWPGGHRGGGARRSGRYGGYGGYGYDDSGAWGAFSSALNYSTSRNAAQQSYLAGQAAAMQQQTAMQSSIRSSMMSQAQAQTQNALGQQQANRNWWFQVEQQQAAQRRSMPSRSYAAAPAMTFEQDAPATQPPKADTDVIRWLPILCEPQFAQQRARVEAPYRRADKGKANPTPADYQTMIDAAGQMKTILKQMAAGISAQEYLDGNTFLDKLVAEAQDRIEKDAKP
jgi:hypothetical protein